MSADLVIKILEKFLQLRAKKRKLVKDALEFLRIDIKLLKREKDYSVHISNCGAWNDEYQTEILKQFHQYCGNIIFKNEDTFFCGEVIYGENEAFWKACKKKDTEEFLHLKEYLSIELKSKISTCELMNFEEQVLKKIKLLKDSYSNVKFTYFRNEMLYNNIVDLDSDYDSCCLLSSSISKVIQQSLRVEFQRQSYALFEVQNCEDLELAIKSKLLQKIHSNYSKMTVEKLREFQGSEKYF